jgi:hypothetical protein
MLRSTDFLSLLYVKDKRLSETMSRIYGVGHRVDLPTYSGLVRGKSFRWGIPGDIPNDPTSIMPVGQYEIISLV